MIFTAKTSALHFPSAMVNGVYSLFSNGVVWAFPFLFLLFFSKSMTPTSLFYAETGQCHIVFTIDTAYLFLP